MLKHRRIFFAAHPEKQNVFKRCLSGLGYRVLN
jgi:hypothetical protein